MPDQTTLVQLCLTRILDAMIATQEELGRLDAAAGDGDHGTGMVRGFRAASAVSSNGTVGQILAAAGAAFSDAAGGASGALIGTFIMTVGQSLPADVIDAAGVHQALEAGEAAIARLGKAKPGDKTMLDTLDPFVKALGAAVANGATLTEGWQTALLAAEQGAHATAELVSRRGRASRLGERSRGHIDPGAMSMLYMLRAVGAVLIENRL